MDDRQRRGRKVPGPREFVLHAYPLEGVNRFDISRPRRGLIVGCHCRRRRFAPGNVVFVDSPFVKSGPIRSNAGTKGYEYSGGTKMLTRWQDGQVVDR